MNFNPDNFAPFHKEPDRQELQNSIQTEILRLSAQAMVDSVHSITNFYLAWITTFYIENNRIPTVVESREFVEQAFQPLVMAVEVMSNTAPHPLLVRWWASGMRNVETVMKTEVHRQCENVRTEIEVSMTRDRN